MISGAKQCEAISKSGIRCRKKTHGGKQYCHLHASRPIRASKPQRLFLITVFLAIFGLIADVTGLISVASRLVQGPIFTIGVDFVQGGLDLKAKCTAGLCNKNFTGASNNSEYESVAHLIFEKDSDNCLAVGISIVNESSVRQNDVRMQIRIPKAEPTSKSAFCNEYAMEFSSPIPDAELARKFSATEFGSTINYKISAIEPGEIVLLTIPLQPVPNLQLFVSEDMLELKGTPLSVTIGATASGSQEEIYHMSFYLEAVHNKAQGLVDHGLLWTLHCNYAIARTACGQFTLADLLSSMFGYQPSYIEYIISYYSADQMFASPNYSTPSPPIEKSVIRSRTPNYKHVKTSLTSYLSMLNSICIEIVLPVEGAKYKCTMKREDL